MADGKSVSGKGPGRGGDRRPDPALFFFLPCKSSILKRIHELFPGIAYVLWHPLGPYRPLVTRDPRVCFEMSLREVKYGQTSDFIGFIITRIGWYVKADSQTSIFVGPNIALECSVSRIHRDQRIHREQSTHPTGIEILNTFQRESR